MAHTTAVRHLVRLPFPIIHTVKSLITFQSEPLSAGEVDMAWTASYGRQHLAVLDSWDVWAFRLWKYSRISITQTWISRNSCHSKLVKMLFECQIARIRMRRLVIWHLIQIQAVCRWHFCVIGGLSVKQKSNENMGYSLERVKETVFTITISFLNKTLWSYAY